MQKRSPGNGGRFLCYLAASEFAGIIRRMVQERIHPQRAVDQLLQNAEFRRRK